MIHIPHRVSGSGDSSKGRYPCVSDSRRLSSIVLVLGLAPLRRARFAAQAAAAPPAGPSAAGCDLRADASDRRRRDAEGGERQGRRCGVRPGLRRRPHSCHRGQARGPRRRASTSIRSASPKRTRTCKKNGVGDRVKVLNQDLFTTDISDGDRRLAVSAADVEPEAAADALENAEARHAHRLARFRHGRLEAGADAERGRRDDLLLDDYAGSGEESGGRGEIGQSDSLQICESEESVLELSGSLRP